MITAKMNDPYCADGVCQKCGQWYCVIELEERKVRNGFCTKCNAPITLVYRRLVVDSKPLVCGYCQKDPVYVEREPGSSIFVIERNGKGDMKINRHPCDLEWERKRIEKERAS